MIRFAVFQAASRIRCLERRQAGAGRGAGFSGVGRRGRRPRTRNRERALSRVGRRGKRQRPRPGEDRQGSLGAGLPSTARAWRRRGSTRSRHRGVWQIDSEARKSRRRQAPGQLQQRGGQGSLGAGAPGRARPGRRWILPIVDARWGSERQFPRVQSDTPRQP